MAQKSPLRSSKIPLNWFIIPLAVAQKSPCHSGPANNGRDRAYRGRMVGRDHRARRNCGPPGGRPATAAAGASGGARRPAEPWWGEPSGRAAIPPKTTFRTIISRQIPAISPIAICDVPRTHPPPARWVCARGHETIDERRAET